MAINGELVSKLVSNANKKSEEFNAEKGILDALMLNGMTLAGIADSGTNLKTGTGKYRAHLEKQVIALRQKIKDLKDNDKFHRRDFLEGRPQTVSASAFWRNSDNIILTFFWTSIILILVPVSLNVYSLPISANQATFLNILFWITVFITNFYFLHYFA